jgi:SAM-dependent methyltransferase
MSASKSHWDEVYTRKAAEAVSWYQPHATTSLALIRASGLAREAPILDVGGGASTLVDDLLADGYRALSVLDLSAAALAQARSRLGAAAAQVAWNEADVTRATLPAHGVALWHDRAVFHFLVEPAKRAAYLRQLEHALRPGGHLIVATFAADGPTQCSGLPVVRYSAESLAASFGPGFELLATRDEIHPTPFGTTQHFVYCHWRRRAPAAAAG